MKLDVTVIPVTPFLQNCTLLHCLATDSAIVIDPGGDLPAILKISRDKHVKIEKILLTHCHLDHCAAAGDLAKRLKIPIFGPHKEDQFWLDLLPQQIKLYGFSETQPFVPDQWLEDGERVHFGAISLEVYHCPGHTPGHIIFFHAESKLAIVGDVLFAGSIGRTDFPKGDHQQLLTSIRKKLWPLGDDVVFIPGHGAQSTFAQERATNLYVADHCFAQP